jgi:hypothetical protein
LGGSRAPKLFAVAVASALAMSVVQVASVPSTRPDRPPYTVKSAITEVKTEVQGTMLHLRRQRDWWLSAVAQMQQDTRVLREKLRYPGAP